MPERKKKMFTEQDYTDYFKSVLLLEEKSVKFTEEFMSRLSDEAVRQKINRINKDEARHTVLSRGLLELLSE